MSCIAVIPARGGSKRVPGKNIRIFNGQPMICWSIAAALESNLFKRVIVSTDNPRIAEVAIGAGAEVPFIRDKRLADDHTGVVEVIRDVLQRLGSVIDLPTHTCLIYATAPFLRCRDLKNGLRLIQERSAQFALSVAKFPAPIDRALVIKQNHIKMRSSENIKMRSQDLPEAYHDAGQFCWGLSKNWLQGPDIFDAVTAPVVLPRTRVQDIDTPEDWEYAELLMRVLAQNKSGYDIYDS